MLPIVRALIALMVVIPLLKYTGGLSVVQIRDRKVFM